MIRYKDLVEYTKENHINWDTELFSVLRDFFPWYMARQSASQTSRLVQRISQETVIPQRVTDFKHPEDGEYSSQDLLDLLST